jgi:hypothetical protein
MMRWEGKVLRESAGVCGQGHSARASQVVVLACLACLNAFGLAAQTIRGQVFDSISGTPLGTGFVVLLDNRGIEVGRTLSDLEGRFVIHAAAPGRYRLRSERIGYAPWETPSSPLPDW